MDRNNAWNKFYASGSISDYLDYIDEIRAEAKQFEQDCKRDSDKRDGIQRE